MIEYLWALVWEKNRGRAFQQRSLPTWFLRFAYDTACIAKYFQVVMEVLIISNFSPLSITRLAMFNVKANEVG